MRDRLGPGTKLGYCTNVHAGQSLDEIKTNLERYALAVKRRVAPDETMGVGLWLPAGAAAALRADDAARAFGDWLAERGLDAFTINGFPYGDFHRRVVKRDVYHPNWTDPRRLAYTIDLLHVLGVITPAGEEASLSTLPVGWRADVRSDDALLLAADRLRQAARAAAAVEAETGVLVHVDIEPEPGCRLDRADDVVTLFDRLRNGEADEAVTRHLRVCHDVCHAAVMFEDQRAVLARYADAGIAVGKVQLSAALRVPFETMSPDERGAAVDRLHAFGEDRYLHQTTIRRGGNVALHEDLPGALAECEPTGEWRIHYHVPLFLDRAGVLETTQDELTACLESLRGGGTRHFEVETYAWEVLPEDLRADDLAAGIAREMAWVIERGRTDVRA